MGAVIPGGFEQAAWLWTLLVVPAAVFAYLLFERRRRAIAAAFTSPAMQPNVVVRPPRWRRHVPVAVYLAAAIALCGASARPYVLHPAAVRQTTVVLAIDTSNSMRATDENPTRLDAARHAATVFLQTVPAYVKVGVVGFSSTAKTVVAPTTDRTAVTAGLASLQPQAGTALGDGLATALAAAKDAGGKATVILLTDGVSNTGTVQPLAAAGFASSAGVPVFTVAVGQQKEPAGGFGVPANSANVDLLSRMSLLTGATTYSVTSTPELVQIYRLLGSRVAAHPYPVEITWKWVLVAGCLVVLGALLAGFWLRRVP
jgi:Ca-activated chloride channel homolog